MELDKLDRSILAVLQGNSRSSFADIGRRVGLSAPAVADRVQKMEQAEVIKNYRVALDYEKMGYALVAIIMFTSYAEKSESFLILIAKSNEVVECYRVTGNYGLFIKVVAKTPAHLEELINKFNEYGQTTTFLVLSTPVESRILK